MIERKVKKIVKGIATQDGAGVKLVRVLHNSTVQDFDPFLMLDSFDSQNPMDYIKGFPWHPHRGIETVTYLIEGEIEHGDSLGNKGVIKDGSCQWMGAGSGIIHQEMPRPSSRMLGAQLWINMPRSSKMKHPTYRDIQASLVPEYKAGDADVRIISGECHGHTGPLLGGEIETLYLDVNIKPGGLWEDEVDPQENAFAFIVLGSAEFSGTKANTKDAVLFEFGKGGKITVKAGPKGVRFLLLAAKPLREPVAWGGPIVMNTQEELEHAFKELELGTFIKHNPPVNKDFYKG